MAARRPTREEYEDRVDTCVKLLGAGLHDGQIKQFAAKQYQCSPRSVERYLRRAREFLRQRRGRDRFELQAESMAFYEQILTSKQASIRDKIQARKRIDKLLGLEEPMRHELAGPGGGPIQASVGVHKALLEDPDLRRLAGELALKAAQKIAARADEHDGPQDPDHS